MATMVALGAVVSSRVLARRGARLPMLGAGLGLATGGVVFVLALVTTSQWALGTAARTAATFDTGDPGTGEPRAAGPLRLLPRDLPQGP